MLKVYNTLTRKTEEFKSIEPKKVKMYCCGPTVYDFVHIGNLRTFIFYDIIRRVLEYDGYSVEQVINLTDVDDKTIKKSVELGIKLSEYTKIYADYFFEDISKLNIKPATKNPRATENIEKMQEMISTLKKKGYAYEAEDGVYFSISKFKTYGALSGLSIGGTAYRIKNDEYDKENATDFALWKLWDKKDGDVYWEGTLPKGRPGWHIECSAMSMKLLGDTIDMHCAAVDLIFPHNENEIAQSEAFSDKKFVNYWLHGEHLLVEGKKMSKSLGNFYTIRDLEKMGFDPMSFRLMVLDNNYHTKLNFYIELLKKYEKTFNDIDIAVHGLEILSRTGEAVVNNDIYALVSSFEESINNDFDTHAALVSFFSVISIINGRIKTGNIPLVLYKDIKEAIEKMDSVLGLLDGYEIPADIKEKAKEREAFRLNKNWVEADKLREQIKNNGYRIVDLKDRYVIIKDRKYA